MQRILALIFCFVLTITAVFGQSDSTAMLLRDVHYDVDTENYFSDYKNAKLIANYYCSVGLSDNERYSYEVVVIDSVLMCGFDAPETETMNYISYQKKQILSREQEQELKNVLETAGLNQQRLGIPRPDVAAHTKEVIIVNYGKLKLQGGMICYGSQEEMSLQAKAARAARERRETSSIGGDYDKFIHLMTGFFTNLDELKKEVMKEK